MKRLLFLSMSFLLSACSWIDDIGTIEKKGSYTVTPTVFSDAEAAGAATVANDALTCIENNLSASFDVFDAQNIQDSIWQIIMYDEVRDRMDATMLGIDFQPWTANDASALCPTPFERIGSPAEISLDGCIRAKLYIGSCNPRQSFSITGSLTLNEFSTERRESVSGEIDGTLFLVQYAKTPEETTRTLTEIGPFRASFQFPVHVGSVWMR